MNMDRLDILVAGKVIETEIAETARRVMLLMENKYQIEEEAMEVMITHFAMASQRIVRGDVVDKMNEDILNEIKSDKTYDRAMDILSDIKSLSDVDFPTSEEQFMLLHICNILKGGEK
ncbi:MAG: PRD domain-containing protein [Anaerorhabdus sp.]